jgi:acetoin utilization protein AcuC
VSAPVEPLLVLGPRSLAYDFGPAHPLTPRRFGPGIDLLRAVGAEPGLAPVPATDEALLRLHLPEYIAAVRRLGDDPDGPGALGIGLSDNPAFAGMHEAAATVAGGSLAGIEALLRGEALHVHHPGGGLHHAMAAGASGFCIYNDAALAVARARSEGLRVLYVDLDVHHGDGVQALTYADPGTLTLSIHESGRYLFPGTGLLDELGSGAAAGTSVNVPLEPYAGDEAWLAAVRALLPTLAAVFGPDLVVSQHGADAHAWDPLAHLRVTTTAMGEAARLVDAVAHRWAGGRWLATGGGGYDAYRVVPRAWALTWLAGAHREPPEATPAAWRDRWEAEAGSFGTPGMPATFLDPPNAGVPAGEAQRSAEQRSLAMLGRVRVTVLPRLVREAEDRGWWAPGLAWAGRVLLEGVGAGSAGRSGPPEAVPEGVAVPVVRGLVAAADVQALALAPRVVSPFDPNDARDLLVAAMLDGARVVAAVSGATIVGLAVAAASSTEPATETLLVVGVAPAFRGGGLGHALLRALIEGRAPGTAMEARIGVAERDVVDPLPVGTRIEVARRLLTGVGFTLREVSPDVARDDPHTIVARLAPG